MARTKVIDGGIKHKSDSNRIIEVFSNIQNVDEFMDALGVLIQESEKEAAIINLEDNRVAIIWKDGVSLDDCKRLKIIFDAFETKYGGDDDFCKSEDENCKSQQPSETPKPAPETPDQQPTETKSIFDKIKNGDYCAKTKHPIPLQKGVKHSPEEKNRYKRELEAALIEVDAEIEILAKQFSDDLFAHYNVERNDGHEMLLRCATIIVNDSATKRTTEDLLQETVITFGRMLETL
jgi:hypothetical protein